MAATKFTRFLGGLALFCAAVICAIFAYCCVFQFVTEKIAPAEALMSALSIILLAVILILTVKAARLPEWMLIGFILLVSLVTRGFFMLRFNTQPDSDFLVLYAAAQGLAAGDFSFLHDNYFVLWAYQIPFVVFEAGVLKLFGTMTALKIINLLCMLGISLLIYKLARLFVSREAAFSFSVLYSLAPEPLLLSSVLTNQHLSLFLLLLGLYLALNERRPVFAFLGGSLIAVGDLVRPEGVLVIASLLFIYILRLISGGEGRKKAFLRFFLLAASFLSLRLLSYILFHAVGLAPFGLNSGCPEWKFILGLDPTQKGTYNETNTAILQISDAAERKKEAFFFISKNFPDFGSLASFLRDKAAYFYGAFPDSSWAFFGADTDGLILFGQPFKEALRTVFIFDRVLFALASLLSAIAFATELMPRAKTPPPAIFCAALCVFFFAAYLLIEVQPRYRYFITPFLFIMSARAADGFSRLLRRKVT